MDGVWMVVDLVLDWGLVGVFVFWLGLWLCGVGWWGDWVCVVVYVGCDGINWWILCGVWG